MKRYPKQLENSRSTHFVKSVHLHSEAINTRHRGHGLQLWDVRGKISLEGNVMKKLVTYVRLFTILKSKDGEYGYSDAIGIFYFYLNFVAWLCSADFNHNQTINVYK